MTRDTVLVAVESALRTLFAKTTASKACPTLPFHVSGPGEPAYQALSVNDKTHAGALMRVNHVGEVCAQALYSAQALASSNPKLKAHFTRAAKEEGDHLAWTAERLEELGARPSALNPLWYAGAFGMGLLAGKLGDRISLGFVQETERQVEAHLQGHLAKLPPNDQASRAIVAQMRDDEAGHALQAQEMGALELPEPVKGLMRSAAKVMTTVAYRI
jgi:ubiquinone biosynthesis monooxygenase Coq7